MNEGVKLIFYLVLVAVGLLVAISYMRKDEVSPTYGFAGSSLYILVFQDRLFFDTFKTKVFFITMLASFFLFKFYSMTESGKTFKKNINLNKYILIYTEIILIISALSYYIFNSIFDLEIFYHLDELRKYIFVEAILVFFFVLITVRRALKEVFVEKDKYRKIFIALNFIYLVIYVAEKVYLYVNLENLKIWGQ
ncbi:hypothetical protein KQI68_07530 [Peptoniphilus sp. MSJ-1]|uniref:Uncharacterized protein n=1 Tax=Peptoniphilus ovalis TaxID=2841503 RepID=A0ABS6FHM7_9FIRM|nr:hypothetical protein [Peptoniphilus ovalis]MBU5669682.1 hypothetical protein [Peptoniphilus ovalis]